MKRFTNCFKPINQPYRVDSLRQRELVSKNDVQPVFIPIYQNDYGHVPMEDDTYESNNIMSNHFTNEVLHSRKWSEYDNPMNIYQPEHALRRYRPANVVIPEIRNHGYDRFLTNMRPSRNNNNLISDEQTMYGKLGPLMRNDNFDVRKPRETVNNIDMYNGRIMSSRM